MTEDEYTTLVKWNWRGHWEAFSEGRMRNFSIEYWGGYHEHGALVTADYHDGGSITPHSRISGRMTTAEAELLIMKLNLLNPAAPK